MEKDKVCIGCKYFDACGDVDRTEPCEGRRIKKDGKETKEHGI